MDTLVRPSVASHARLRLPTRRPTEFLDITDAIARLVCDAGLRLGFVNVQTCHTTTAIVVNEHEPLLLEDFAVVLEAAAPAARAYRHDDLGVRRVNLTPDERVNGHAHCRALVLAASACLNVAGGELQLGRWQRVFLVELDGPREREVSVVLMGEGRS
jgi:secondary thiamine-phosphate synthase enzyme